MSVRDLLARPKSGRTYPEHAARGVSAPTLAPPRPLPLLAECVHLGARVGKGCGSLVRACHLHGTTTTAHTRCPDAVRHCPACPDRVTAAPLPAADGTLRFDRRTLFPDAPGLRFNTSILAHESGYLICWRIAPALSRIWIGRLDAQFRPVGAALPLNLAHPMCAEGQDDPMLFGHAGAVHVAFTGVERTGTGVRANVLYARLTAALEVERVFAPHYPARNAWEKNWAFFSHEGALYAVYSVAPHRILRIDGDRAELAHETPLECRWEGGELRGGAAPLRVGDEYLCFAHSSVGIPRPGMPHYRVYDVPAYTFEARPPFRVTSITPRPLWVADESQRPGEIAYSVLFPRGAVQTPDGYAVSAGAHDRWTEIRTVSAAELERATVPLAPPAWWAWEPESWDAVAWREVVAHDVYDLMALDLRGATVLDLGAHVGTFAYLARRRGAARVVCYEPDAESLRYLCRNARALGGVEVVAAHVGGAVGPAFRSERAGDIRPAPVGAVATLDEVVAAAAGDNRIALLKLDIEGGEWPALAGATDLSRVDRIAGEWHRREIAGREWGPDDLAPLLAPHGFAVRVTTDAVLDCGQFVAERATAPPQPTPLNSRAG